MKQLLSVGIIGILCSAATAHAQQVALPFEVTNEVRNEFGNIMPGTSVRAPDFGRPFVQGAVVQILDASTGIYPPDTNGVPDARNPLISTSRIGAGMAPSLALPGRVSGTITEINRQTSRTNIYIMARVFNKATVEDSSFYADSTPQNVPTAGGERYGVVSFNVGNTTNALDNSDHDADGLSRSWEKSYGTNADDPDSDSDGMLDGHETRAGTGAMDPTSLLVMVQLSSAGGDNLRVTWDSVPGKKYQLQFVEALTNGATFANIGGVVTAAEDETSGIVTNGLLNPAATYRVQLVEQKDIPAPPTP